MKKLILVFVLIIISVFALNIAAVAADKVVIYASVDEGNAKKY